MRIPNGPTDEMTVSASQIRTYGAGGFRLDSHEDSKGCPRLYKAKYVDRDVPEEKPSYPLLYGTMFHEALFLMEDKGLNPDEALQEAFPVSGTPEMMAEAKTDMTAYLERGASPIDRFGTLAVETQLSAVLYEDEEHGTVRWRGFLDWLGMDMDDPNTIHVVDYKTNRNPPRTEDVISDVQLKSYAWLVRENSKQFGIPQDRVRVIVHLDAVKWREIAVEYTYEEIEDWQDWAIAICRAILRDDEALPVINPGCDFCPIRFSCPAFDALPETAKQMAEGLSGIEDPEKRLAWRDAANKVRLLLEKQVKSIDSALADKAMTEGGLIVGNQQWVVEQEWGDKWDLPTLHRAMGDRFYEVVNPVKGRIDKITKDWTPDAAAAVQRAVERVPGNVKAKRKKVETSD